MVTFRKETETALRHAYELMLHDVAADIAFDHVDGTPDRVVRAYKELFSGVGCDPASVLRTSFQESDYNQMIIVKDIDFNSMCMHHLLPFHGVVHFGYLPKGRVVGLSKIPRLVEVLSHRPQIQEKLTQQLVDIFQEVIQPLGCGAVVEAWHACAGMRGVRKPRARMRTTALTGLFLSNSDARGEFLLGIR